MAEANNKRQHAPNADAMLILRAANLARHAPRAYEDFIAALKAVAAQDAENCVHSPLDDLQRAQGRAQATARLHKNLANAVASAEKLERQNQ